MQPIDTEAPPARIEGGWRVRETATYFVDILDMGVNRRIVLTRRDEPGFYDRSWCYPRSDGLAAVALRAHGFDPEAGQEPVGWIKEPRTERRACAAYRKSALRAHAGFDPDCPDCGNEALN